MRCHAAGSTERGGGARILREGGNAVDALLATAFTAFVTEGPLTGPTGGGFLLVHEPGGETTVLECFFAVPSSRLGAMEEVVIDFADSGTQVFHIGLGSVAVPGLLAGLEEAHRRFATRSWRTLSPPLSISARDSCATSSEHSCTDPEPILLRQEGGRRTTVMPPESIRGSRPDPERVRDVGSAATPSSCPSSPTISLVCVGLRRRSRRGLGRRISRCLIRAWRRRGPHDPRDFAERGDKRNTRRSRLHTEARARPLTGTTHTPSSFRRYGGRASTLGSGRGSSGPALS
jgi:hypothetical protein